MLQSWDAVFSEDRQLSVLNELCQLHLSHCYGEQSLEIAKMLEARDYLGLCKFELRYGEDEDVTTLLHLRQVLAFFKKSQLDLPGVSVDREAAAWEKFIQAEADCKLTNECFRARARGEFQFRPYVEGILHAASRKISRVLGDCPSISDLHLAFGPGATTEVARRNASARTKLSAGFQCSPSLSHVLPSLLREIPGWYTFQCENTVSEIEGCHVDVVDGSLGFVPKSRLIYRVVVVEPVLNTLFQGGIGRWVAERLRTEAGLDIRRQEPNQVLARQGSIDGSLATIDLSSASDTIATNLILDLLPDDWFDLLASARSGHVRYGKKRIMLEKFSSMGNGYTFPLETLLFWALAESVVQDSAEDGEVRVYGDDIIVPANCAVSLMGVLRDLGFTPNPSKSFWTGPFRESCGRDYYKGIDIRPAYIENVGYPQLFSLYNFYRENLLDEFASRVLNWIPEALRLWGPPGYGDGHLHSKEWGRPAHRDKGYAGFLFDSYTFLSPKLRVSLPGDQLLPCYTVYARGGGRRMSEYVPLRSLRGLTTKQSSTCRMRTISYSDVVEFLHLGSPEPQQVLVRPYKGRKKELLWNTVLPGVARDKQTGLSYKKVSIYTLTCPG